MSYIQELLRSNNSNSPGTTYLVNYERLKEKNNSDKVHNKYKLEKYILNQKRISRNHIVLIRALIEHTNLENQKVVLKISNTIEKLVNEYNISKKLKDIKGFIQYIDIHTCFDNTNSNTNLNGEFTSTNEKVLNPKQICKALKIEENKRVILVMPYYKNGSIENYIWTLNNVSLLKKLLGQVISNCYNAYKIYGFIHNDLAFRNILIDDAYNALIMDMTDHILYNNSNNSPSNFINSTIYIENIRTFWEKNDKFLNELTEFKTVSHYSQLKLQVNSDTLLNIKQVIINNIRNNLLSDELIQQIINLINELKFEKKLSYEEQLILLRKQY